MCQHSTGLCAESGMWCSQTDLIMSIFVQIPKGSVSLRDTLRNADLDLQWPDPLTNSAVRKITLLVLQVSKFIKSLASLKDAMPLKKILYG